MQLTILRDAPRLDCQQGILTLAGGETYYTLERPWLQDRPEVSCVPRGTYTLIPHEIEHGALLGLRTWALSNPGLGVFPEAPAQYGGPNPLRVACLIHPANWVFQLEGCIAVGKGRGLLTPPGQSAPLVAVLSSDEAFGEIVNILGENSLGHELIIQ